MLHQRDMRANSATQLKEFYATESKRYHQIATDKLDALKSNPAFANHTKQKDELSDLDYFLLLKVASNNGGNLALYGLYHGEIMNRICQGERFSPSLRTEINEANNDSPLRKFLAQYDAVVTKFFSAPSAADSSTTSTADTQTFNKGCAIL